MERLHQWGMHMRRRFWTAKDPLEKAASPNMHPNVLAKVESTDVENKQILSERKADLISIKRQKQHNEGQFQALEYVGHAKEEKLTWAAVLFNKTKVDLYEANAKDLEYLCHLNERCTK